jgi:hypothetical protein
LPDRARDVVLAAAREGADAHGVVKRETIVEAARGRMADKTLNAALTDLVACGDLGRVRNGLYSVPGVGGDAQLPLGGPEC